MRVFWLVISHVFFIEIILRIISNVEYAHIIPVFNFGSPTDFFNSYSLNFRHEAFHHSSHSHTIIYMSSRPRTKSQKRRYIIIYTA